MGLHDDQIQAEEAKRAAGQGYTYLASPYSHESLGVRVSRYLAARDFCLWALVRNLPVFSPIVHWHPIQVSKPELPFNYEAFKAQNDAMVLNAGSITVLNIDGWQQSKGVAYEIELARSIQHKRGLPLWLATPRSPLMADFIIEYL